MSVYGRVFLLNERIYSNKALRQIITLPGGGLCPSLRQITTLPGGIRDFFSRFTVCLCMVEGFLLNERIYSNKALRQITTLPGAGGGGGRGTFSLALQCVCVW